MYNYSYKWVLHIQNQCTRKKHMGKNTLYFFSQSSRNV